MTGGATTPPTVDDNVLEGDLWLDSVTGNVYRVAPHYENAKIAVPNDSNEPDPVYGVKKFGDAGWAWFIEVISGASTPWTWQFLVLATDDDKQVDITDRCEWGIYTFSRINGYDPDDPTPIERTITPDGKYGFQTSMGVYDYVSPGELTCLSYSGTHNERHFGLTATLPDGTMLMSPPMAWSDDYKLAEDGSVVPRSN